ncbi:MAG: DUF424 family protein [Candidatus Aenigmarchaeota archaeon]|nr:DUF424 family protein [Candidatus Aenigmarchaeota archaeon]
MFILKTHNTDTGNIVAVSDSNLLGKRFEENDTVLDISDDFYDGKKADIDTIISAISTCTSAIIIGDNIISELKKNNVLTPEHILFVSKTPYAMIFKV